MPVTLMRALPVIVIAVSMVMFVTVLMTVVVLMIMLLLGEEVRIDFELCVQVKAAQIEDFLDLGVAEIHDLDCRARVHVQQAMLQRFELVRRHEIGLRDEQAIGETDLTLHDFVLNLLSVADSDHPIVRELRARTESMANVAR